MQKDVVLDTGVSYAKLRSVNGALNRYKVILRLYRGKD